MNSIELRKQRKQLADDSKAWLKQAEADGLPESEVQEQWHKRMAEVDRLEAEVNRMERHEQAARLDVAEDEKPTSRKAVPGAAKSERAFAKGDKNTALRAWLSYGSGAKVRLDERSVSLASEAGMPLESHSVEVPALRSILTGSTGANAVYGSMSPNIETELKYYSPIISDFTTEVTDNGNDWAFTKSSDVTRVLGLVAEGEDSADDVDPTFTRVTSKAYTFRQIQVVSYEQLQDSGFDLESHISRNFYEAAGRTVEQYGVKGTGSSQPQGFLPVPSGGQILTLGAGVKKVETFNTLMSLVQKVDPAYRPYSKFVFHDTMQWDLRQIEDDNGRHIWDVSVQTGMPDRILGSQYVISNSVDATDAFSKKIAWYGALNRQHLRLVNALQIQRLNEVYAKKLMVGFQVMMRFDCRYLGHASSAAVLATPAS